MYQGKIAIKTPAGNYRIASERIGRFRFEPSATGMFQDFLGDLADRIGEYEDCNTIEDMNRVRKKFGLKELKK